MSNKWSKDLPEKPGWYWVSWFSQGEWSKPEIVEIYMYHGELCEVECTSDGGDYFPVKHWGGEHMIQGPLEPDGLPGA